jgi:hypothetical protein
MSPEAAVVVALSRTNPSEANKKRARSRVAAGVNWDVLRALAHHWKVEPVVAMNLRAGVAGDLTAERLTWAREWERGVRTAALLQATELSRLVALLRDQQIETLALKGPALARAAYGDFSLRSSSDIDLVLESSNLVRAAEVLCAAGYEPGYEHSSLSRLIRGGHALEFYREDGQVELHSSLLPGHLRLDFSEHDVWSATGAVTFMDTEIRTPGAALHFLYLCAHGAKHRWSLLRWTCDLSQLGQLMSRSDIEMTAQLAGTYRAERILALGLRVVRETFGDPLDSFDDATRKRANETVELARVANDYLELGLNSESGQSSGSLVRVHPYLQPLLYWMRCRERWLDRVASAASFAFVPAPVDPAGRFAGALRPIRAVTRTLRARRRPIGNTDDVSDLR